MHDDKAIVTEDDFGGVHCGMCDTMLICDECGDMPDACPSCGRPLDYAIYETKRSDSKSET